MSDPAARMLERVRESVDAIWRADSRRVLATLIRLLGDFDLADEALHTAFAAAMEEFDREIGFENLGAIHCNDSKAALGAGRDLHDNIGDGKIGRDGFAALLAHPALANTPLILEVPGYKIDGAGKGPDKPNVDRLKEIRAAVGAKA